MLLSQEELDKLNIKDNYEKQEKENNLNEPIPKNNYCYICQRKFNDYLLHIETQSHKENLKEQNSLYVKNIKNTFKIINKFWNNEISEETNKSFNEFCNETSEVKESKTEEENNKIKSPILTSSFIQMINEDIKNDENNLDNKENINENNNDIIFDNYIYNCENNCNLKDNNVNKKDFSRFKLLKKKRITFDVIRYESPIKKNIEIKRRDYFNYLNKYKTKKFIRNINVFFE